MDKVFIATDGIEGERQQLKELLGDSVFFYDPTPEEGIYVVFFLGFLILSFFRENIQKRWRCNYRPDYLLPRGLFCWLKRIDLFVSNPRRTRNYGLYARDNV